MSILDKTFLEAILCFVKLRTCFVVVVTKVPKKFEVDSFINFLLVERREFLFIKLDLRLQLYRIPEEYQAIRKLTMSNLLSKCLSISCRYHFQSNLQMYAYTSLFSFTIRLILSSPIVLFDECNVEWHLQPIFL